MLVNTLYIHTFGEHRLEYFILIYNVDTINVAELTVYSCRIRVFIP